MKTLTKVISVLIFLTISLINNKALATEDVVKANVQAASESKEAPKEEGPIEPLKLVCKLMPQMCI